MGNGRPERGRDLPKVTQQVQGRTRVQIQVTQLPVRACFIKQVSSVLKTPLPCGFFQRQRKGQKQTEREGPRDIGWQGQTQGEGERVSYGKLLSWAASGGAGGRGLQWPGPALGDAWSGGRGAEGQGPHWMERQKRGDGGPGLPHNQSLREPGLLRGSA